MTEGKIVLDEEKGKIASGKQIDEDAATAK